MNFNSKQTKNIDNDSNLVENNGSSDVPADHFMSRDGEVFAGVHLIIDFWGAENLDNLELMDKTLHAAIDASGATLLHIHLHHFTPSDGISGVALLAESHISVHTWPERSFAAFDIFMCGDTEPEKCIAILKNAFKPQKIQLTEHRRGKTSDENS